MRLNSSTPWHKSSFVRFVQDSLPHLLAERLPLVGYQAKPSTRYTWRATVTLGSSSGDIKIEYNDLPQPDDEGLFKIDDQLCVVIPTASQEELDIGEIHCVGEQLYDFIQERLGQAPSDLPWDGVMARAWLSLDTWVHAFLRSTAQKLDTRNWLSRHTHLRRLLIPNREKVIAPGQFGRVCPFELPEGPNLGRVFTVAVGAEIRDGKLIIVDERQEAGLGLSASMIPFLEHSDPNRLLMGANMMRQWFVPPEPEPALVQTDFEPDEPGFWCGRNLLTAYISWDADTFADGIVISESCARRLDFPYPAEPGDKLGNRHGTKGVVSRVLPDDEMPHLPDGTPVELVYSFYGMHVRMNFGQVLEAVASRIARAEGTPVIAPPFHAPRQDELRRRLIGAGLPESGMETLTLGRGGPKLKRPSTVGWVYWGRLAHLAQDKIKKSVSSEGGQKQGELEHYALRDLAAYENLAEYVNTRAIRREDAGALAARVAAGPVEQAKPPSPLFSELAERLRVAGIQADLKLENGPASAKLAFSLRSPTGDVLELAHPVQHPWLPEQQLTKIGIYPALEAYAPLVETNARLERMIANQAPERLLQDTLLLLETRLKAVFESLLTPDHLRFGERLLFSGRAVVTPGRDLRLAQVGLPNEMAWTLFGPLVIREMGEEDEVENRTPRAAKVLDEVMARSWIIVNRAPSLTPTALLAFHPVRNPDYVIRLHPLVCEMLDADFDGDQVAVLLPVTAGAQREAGERLSVASHLARDPGLLHSLLPPPDALWGLASLSLTTSGQHEIARLAGIEIAAPAGFITRDFVANAMEKVLARDGVEKTLLALESLTRRGYEVAKESGASMSPFIGANLRRAAVPAGDDTELWDAYADATLEQIISRTDYDDNDLGPQLLAVKIRERGLRHLGWLIGPRGTTTDLNGKPSTVRHSYVEGLTIDEMYACVAGARRGLAGFLAKWDELDQDVRNRHRPSGFNVLARARRSKRPGIVFARAAATGEVDPLADVDSRLLVGLPVTEHS